MNKLLTLVAVAAMMLMVVGTSSAQNTASATADAKANIVAPIKIIWNQPLSFGQFTVGSGGGTAMVGVTGVNVPNQNYILGNPSTTGDVVALSTAQATAYSGNKNPGPAVFTVTGEKNFTFGVYLPPVTQSVPVAILNQDPGPNSAQMYVANFTCVVGNPGVVGQTGTLSIGAGIQFFAVGGTLTVPANAVPGSYTGQFAVTAYYN